jgi:phosphoribosylanthranilate isomerase
MNSASSRRPASTSLTGSRQSRQSRLSPPSPPSTAAGALVAVKICGVTDIASALLSAELGATFLGLNFWPGSSRYVDLDRARQIAAAVRAAAPDVVLVGVFVDPSAAAIAAADGAAGLDLLQFSGDESAAAVRPHARRAIKAIRLPPGAAAAGSAPTAMPVGWAAFDDCWGLLLDAPRHDAVVGSSSDRAHDYGGTGRSWNYAALAGARTWLAERRVFLAGGLAPDNVGAVLSGLAPFAVDVCSGVESAPGTKDPKLLRRLFEEIGNAQVTNAP